LTAGLAPWNALLGRPCGTSIWLIAATAALQATAAAAATTVTSSDAAVLATHSIADVRVVRIRAIVGIRTRVGAPVASLGLAWT
jgi:hypothetical protein